jgi:hypothetical protein
VGKPERKRQLARQKGNVTTVRSESWIGMILLGIEIRMNTIINPNVSIKFVEFLD